MGYEEPSGMREDWPLLSSWPGTRWTWQRHRSVEGSARGGLAQWPAGPAANPGVGRYVIVFTELPTANCTGTKVLKLYRFRWQVALALEPFKPLTELANLPWQEDGRAKVRLAASCSWRGR